MNLLIIQITYLKKISTNYMSDTDLELRRENYHNSKVRGKNATTKVPWKCWISPEHIMMLNKYKNVENYYMLEKYAIWNHIYYKSMQIGKIEVSD